MFQLIIALLSIALIAILAIASVYYGGSAFTSGSAKAAASTVVAQAQQISAANVLYSTENGGANAADVASLTTGGYLQSTPKLPDNIGGTLEIDQATGLVYGEVANDAICDSINKQLGVTTAPTATSEAASDLATAITEQYGCAVVDEAFYFAYH